MTKAKLIAALLFAPTALIAQRAETLAPLKVIDTSYMNRKANACVDFFDFANGGWYARDTIPAAYSSSGVGHDVMARRKSMAQTSTPRKLGTFYASCMDSTAAEKAGIDPIKSQLSQIDKLSTRADLLKEIATMHVAGADVGFGYGPDVDPHDAAHYLAEFGSGGLGLPDRDYYVLTDPSSDSLRTFYVDHITRTLTLAGETPTRAGAEAKRILALETELAKATLTRVERRDPAALDHPVAFAAFSKSTPNVNWTSYFSDVGLGSPPAKLNVSEPKFMTRFAQLFNTTSMDDWKAYLRYHAIQDASPWLSTPFVNEASASPRNSAVRSSCCRVGSAVCARRTD
jgi:predicted metalloendopeptidase